MCIHIFFAPRLCAACSNRILVRKTVTDIYTGRNAVISEFDETLVARFYAAYPPDATVSNIE